MTSLSQSPRDRILWILANSDGRMERNRLRACTGMRYALLNPILEELAKEGRHGYISEGEETLMPDMLEDSGY